jgi:hypothetical protein
MGKITAGGGQGYDVVFVDQNEEGGPGVRLREHI